MQAYIRLVLRHRWLFLLAIVVLTCVAAVALTRAVVASTIGGLFLGEHPDYPRYLERVADFGSDDFVIVGVEEPLNFDSEAQRRLHQAVTQIERIPWVSSVRTPLDVQRVESSADGIRIERYGDLALRRPEEREALAKRLQQEPGVRSVLVADDCRHYAIVVELDASTERPAEETPDIIDGIRAALLKAGYPRESLHVVGLSANVAGVIEETYFNIERLFPLVLVVLLCAVWLMFRRVWPVFISGAVTLIASVWTLAFAVTLDRHVNIFIGMVPAIILIIGFCDVVHLCSAYLLELERTGSKQEAVLRSGSDVGTACLFTSVTTFVGFVSLSTVPTPVSRLLGVVLGFGAAVALLVALTLTPILLSLIEPGKPWRKGAPGMLQGTIDHVLKGCANLATEHPRAVLFGFAAFATASLMGLTQLTIETDFVKRMSPDHPLQQDLAYYRQHFVGANTIDVYLTTPEPGGLLDAQRLAAVAAYQEALSRDPKIDSVYSLVDVVRTVWGALSEEPTGRALPQTREALAQCLLLFEAAGGEDLERLIDFERQRMRLMLRLEDQEFRRTAVVGKRAKALGHRLLGAGMAVDVSGFVYILGQGFDDILHSQRRALLLVFASIAIMMIVGLRSLRVGLWSMIPNLLPLAAVGGYTGFFFSYVDSDILIIWILALGIGVDDTIHFLTRLRIEAQRRAVTEAIQETFAYSGRGILMTTVILVLGFAPFALSDYFTVRVFGTMLPLTLTVALVGDLLLVPALVRLGLMRFHCSAHPDQSWRHDVSA